MKVIQYTTTQGYTKTLLDNSANRTLAESESASGLYHAIDDGEADTRVSDAELNTLKGVTSSIQEQINGLDTGKADAMHTHIVSDVTDIAINNTEPPTATTRLWFKPKISQSSGGGMN